MQITYQKLGNDHPMFGKVDFLVADGTTPLCYKTKDGYQPLESSISSANASATAQVDIDTKPLYVLSFKVNGEAEEETFTSKKKLDKTIALYSEKAFITDLKTTAYKTVA
ncbi:MAG: hypothetical protein ISEC1_P0454 [Thiomicrorhabdus sp.]|nr:MAG: hypothetical protein ISEC1_P0454 [Thiomicrorhabdus sp.]